MRRRLGGTVVDAARGRPVHERGTFEFLPTTRELFFLEVNTAWQVGPGERSSGQRRGIVQGTSGAAGERGCSFKAGDVTFDVAIRHRVPW